MRVLPYDLCIQPDDSSVIGAQSWLTRIHESPTAGPDQQLHRSLGSSGILVPSCAAPRRFRRHWLSMWFGSSWSTSSVRMMDRNLTIRGRAADTPSTVCCRTRRLFGGLKVSGCSHGLVGRRSDFGGDIDKAAAGWFGERDDLVGRDLLWSHHHLTPSNRFSPCSMATSASPWARMAMIRAGAARPG